MAYSPSPVLEEAQHREVSVLTNENTHGCAVCCVFVVCALYVLCLRELRMCMCLDERTFGVQARETWWRVDYRQTD